MSNFMKNNLIFEYRFSYSYLTIITPKKNFIWQEILTKTWKNYLYPHVLQKESHCRTRTGLPVPSLNKKNQRVVEKLSLMTTEAGQKDWKINMYSLQGKRCKQRKCIEFTRTPFCCLGD